MADPLPVTYREVPGFPGYRVGDDGSLWSCRDFQGGCSAAWRRLRYRAGARGYVNAGLRRDGRYVFVAVHTLVLTAFIGPPPPDHEACHENGIRSDNRLSNLRWDTHDRNLLDRARHGTVPRGAQIKGARLTEADVRNIRALRLTGLTPKALAERFGVKPHTIAGICARRKWRWVEGA